MADQSWRKNLPERCFHTYGRAMDLNPNQCRQCRTAAGEEHRPITGIQRPTALADPETAARIRAILKAWKHPARDANAVEWADSQRQLSAEVAAAKERYLAAEPRVPWPDRLG